jgi:hypothetical protein
MNNIISAQQARVRSQRTVRRIQALMPDVLALVNSAIEEGADSFGRLSVTIPHSELVVLCTDVFGTDGERLDVEPLVNEVKRLLEYPEVGYKVTMHLTSFQVSWSNPEGT